MPAPRADPTNTFLARHIIEPGTEYTNVSPSKSGCKALSKVSADYFNSKISRKYKQYDKMITHIVHKQINSNKTQAIFKVCEHTSSHQCNPTDIFL